MPYQIPLYTYTGWGRSLIVDMNDNGEPQDDEVRARYVKCPLRKIACRELESEREHRIRKVILEEGFDCKNYRSNFACFENYDENGQWSWLNLSMWEKLYLARVFREAGLCKPKRYSVTYQVTNIEADEVVITNDQMEIQWVEEMIGDFMRVESEKPESRNDNLYTELLLGFHPDEVEKVIEGHDLMRDVNKKCLEIMNKS